MSATTRQQTRSKHERGVALLMVVAAIAILTAVAVEFSYHSRVEARLATNARDSCGPTTWPARRCSSAGSCCTSSGRSIRFRFRAWPGAWACSGGRSAMGNVGVATRPASPHHRGRRRARRSSSLHLRLWDIIPVDSGTLQLFIGPPPPLDSDFGPPWRGGRACLRSASGAARRSVRSSADRVQARACPARPFGDFDGTFHADVTDEESKINVNALNQLSTQAAATATEMLTLMHWKDQKYDFLFDDNADTIPSTTRCTARTAEQPPRLDRHRQPPRPSIRWRWRSSPTPSLRASATRTSSTSARIRATAPRTPPSTRSTSSTWFTASPIAS